MSDAMIRALAENGGVIMINFGCAFLTEESQKASDRISDYRDEHGYSSEDPEYLRFREENSVHADVHDVVDHINHVVSLVGVDFVGLGSDFDGVSWIPIGLEDVSKFPNLIGLLIEEGYSEEDIAKIMGENVLRVWEKVEAVAARLAAS